MGSYRVRADSMIQCKNWLKEKKKKNGGYKQMKECFYGSKGVSVEGKVKNRILKD